MKHVFTSAGLLALGAASIYAYDPQMTRQQTGRPWSVAATVRGFYDDNPTTSPDKYYQPVPGGGFVSVKKEGSYGIELSPSAHLNLPLEQTFISLGYLYSLKWYEDRDNSTDQGHEFNGKLRHQFSPRHDLGIDDSFILTSEPTVADRFGIVTTPTRLRTSSDVLHNRGAIEDNIGLSQKFALSLGYMNNWYDYDQEGVGSRSALLDRIEHLIRLDARYQVNPSLVGLVGYSFGIGDYTGDDTIAFDPRTLRPIKSDERDYYQHRFYVGADYDMNAKLRASLRVGAEYFDYHNSGESSFGPYADASLTYTYLPGSSVQFGVRHTRNATDIVSPAQNGTPTLDQETTALYGQVSHRITRKLTGNLIGQFQNSEFNDGQADSDSEQLYLVGINLDYRFNEHFSAEAGYNYDMLQSNINNRSYDRNRVYIGLTASY